MKRNLYPKLWTALGVALLIATLPACSSSPSGGEEAGDEAALDGEIPDLEAGTDAVPMGDLEQVEKIEDLPSGSLASDAETPPADAAAQPLADAAPPADAMAAAPEATPLDSGLAAPADAPLAGMADSTESSPPASSDTTFAGGGESYTVQAGDTLMKIAFETYGDLYQWRKIYEMNQDHIQDPNNLPPGVTLKLESPSSPVQLSRNGERYLIKMGDTLGTISDDIYGTPSKWRKLWENNSQLIKDPNRIFAGFHLYYTITPEEQGEAERMKQMRQEPASPLATGGTLDDRGPASATAPAPVPVTPGT